MDGSELYETPDCILKLPKSKHKYTQGVTYYYRTYRMWLPVATTIMRLCTLSTVVYVNSTLSISKRWRTDDGQTKF